MKYKILIVSVMREGAKHNADITLLARAFARVNLPAASGCVKAGV